MNPGLARLFIRLAVALWVCCLPVAALAQARLALWVVDASGGGISGASVVALSDGKVVAETTSGARGGAEIVPAGASVLHLIVAAPGLETVELDVAVTAKQPTAPVTITLPIAGVTDEVVVAGTPKESGASSFALTPAEVDALPDDEESLLRMLEDLAGPGADIRVDGFAGRLPRKDQILRITVRRDAYSAELPQPGQGRVDILTRPNAEFWRGNGSVQYRPSGLAANNALARQSGSGTYRSLNGSIAGPLVKNKTAMFFEGESTNSEDSRAITAITPAGPFLAAVDQPSDSYRMNVRLETMVSKTTLMRLTWSGEESARDNQGLSALDLPERGYEQRSSQQSLRVSIDGGNTRPYFVRLRGEYQRDRSVPDTLARTIIVNNAFRSGGATQIGQDRDARADLESAITLLTRGPVNIRTGGQVIWNRDVQGVVRNTLGTFTFLNLDAYLAETPATFTQRVGARALTIGTFQAATFAQADVQLKAGWSLGLGARYQWQTNLDDRGALSPRLGLSRAMNQGRTTVRGGYGWYYGWLPTNVWEENLRLSSGSSERELIVRTPGFPDPFSSGDLDALDALVASLGRPQPAVAWRRQAQPRGVSSLDVGRLARRRRQCADRRAASRSTERARLAGRLGRPRQRNRLLGGPRRVRAQPVCQRPVFMEPALVRRRRCPDAAAGWSNAGNRMGAGAHRSRPSPVVVDRHADPLGHAGRAVRPFAAGQPL